MWPFRPRAPDLEKVIRQELRAALRPPAAPSGSMTGGQQMVVILCMISAVLVLGLAPVITAGIMGKNLPDALIAVSDKTITGLIGVLGTYVGMRITANRAEELRAESASMAAGNTAKALDTINKAIDTPTASQSDQAGKAAGQVADAASEEAQHIKDQGA